MAVARHCENIEVQDEDQDDTIYENETTITTRRTNVEMSEEGHYERLDLQKIDDAYEDLRTKTRKDKGLPKKIRQSGRRPFRVAAGCLGMLCLISMGVNIAQAVLYRSINNKLTQEKNWLKSDNNQLKSDNNQLKRRIADKSCPSGWKKFGCSCYYIATEEKTWQQSRDYCRNQGADLVVINSGEEQVFIRGLNPGGHSWIGLTRTEARWTTWVDGTPLTTQYWRPGEPDNVEDRKCAAFDPATGSLYNEYNSSTKASICEK